VLVVEELDELMAELWKKAAGRRSRGEEEERDEQRGPSSSRISA